MADSTCAIAAAAETADTGDDWGNPNGPGTGRPLIDLPLGLLLGGCYGVCMLATLAMIMDFAAGDGAFVEPVEVGRWASGTVDGELAETDLANPKNVIKQVPPSVSAASDIKSTQPFFTRRLRVTAYCPCKKCCGKWADGLTASGKKARWPMVAAPPELPFGTMMKIPGYAGGRAVEVTDRGGVIKGDRLDVFFATHAEALAWGVRWLEVDVYKKNDRRVEKKVISPGP